MAGSHNFSACPTAVPLEVLTQAHEEFFDFAGTGSVMKISHRSRVFMDVARQAKQDLRASLYNAVSLTAVAALTDFMADFARAHG